MSSDVHSEVAPINHRSEPDRAENAERWEAALRTSRQQLDARLGLESTGVDRFPETGGRQGIAAFDAVSTRTVRARLLLMGFRCVRPTWDHAFNADGWGDEIYLTSGFSWLYPDGSEREPLRSFRTPVYGQRRDQGWFGSVFTKWPERIESGHRTRFGGIGANDFGGSFIPPWDTHQEWHWPTDPQHCPLPVVMWEWVGPEDQLTGTVLATPTVWEGDWGAPLDPDWGDSAVATIREAARGIAAVGGVIGKFFPLAAGVAALASVIDAALPTVFRTGKNIIGEAGDRPVGQIRNDADGVRTYNPPVVAVDLSRAAEAAALQQGFGPGVFVCPVQDSNNIGGGRYESFVAFTFEVI